MTKPVINGFTELAELLVHQYERYLPTAFDESLSLLQKVNKIINYLNETGVLVNDIVAQWNTVFEWVMGDGLKSEVDLKLDEMFANGDFNEIINETLFNDLELRLDALEANLNYRTSSALYADEHGLIGNGVTDDTLKFKDLITKAQTEKKKVVLSPGKKYLISSQILITKDVEIVGNAINKPIIYVATQDFDPIKAEGAFVTETSLTANATVNTKHISVGNAAGIVPGMLLEIISSLPWYHDPRTESSDARKAELHRVDEVSGNLIHLTDPLMDGYDLSKETVAIKAYSPINVHVENVKILMTRGPEPNDNYRKTGIQLRYTIDSMLKNVDVENATNAGISLYHSYRPTVDGGRTVSANNYFSGYGLQTYGTTHAVIKNRYTLNSRRAVDISGGNIPSHYSVVEGCTVFANGLNSLLDRYGYNDNHTAGTYAGGIGTHGPADHTIIRNNYLGYLHTGIIVRGRNTIVEDNYFVGDFYTNCIDVSYALNIHVKGNIMYDGFTGNKETLISDGGANYNTRKPDHFIRFQYTSLENGSNGSYVEISDNFVMVENTFIVLYAPDTITSIGNQNNMIIKNNYVNFTPQYTSGDCSFIRKDAPGVGTILLSESVFINNIIKRTDGVGTFKYFNGVDIRHGSQIEGPKSYSFYMSTDTADYVWMGGELSPYCVVLVTCAGATGMIRLSRGVAGGTSFGTLVNVEGAGVALTGTTGTAGKLSVSFTSDGKIHIENRLGSTQRIGLTVMNWF